MKKTIIVILLMSLIYIGGCSKDEEKPLPAGTHSVEVLESMDAAQYTYIRAAEGDNEYWIAIPQMEVKEGERLYYSKSMTMNNFQSNTLNRSFDKILFVDDISRTLPSANLQTKINHPKIQSIQDKNIKIEPVKGGKTVEQIFSEKDKIAGSKVKVRGKVVKYNSGIMDRNWIHLQDGTGSGDDYDLIVTTQDASSEGEIITVEGAISVNKDFGSGYVYPVLIENAEIK